jgi:hypothetical protein
MLTVIESPEFIASAARLWNDGEREAFIDWIAAHAQAGDAIPGAGGLCKVRWKRSGMGKRGGARVIYFERAARGEVLLVTAYAKGRVENIPAPLLRALLEKCNVKN